MVKHMPLYFLMYILYYSPEFEWRIFEVKCYIKNAKQREKHNDTKGIEGWGREWKYRYSMSLVRIPLWCLIELDCNLIVHTHAFTVFFVHSFMYALNQSHWPTHPPAHKHCFDDSFSRTSVACFPREPNMDSHKVSGTNRYDRKHCSWPSFSYSRD